ncbi:MAG: PEP-CTERM sorting domain-containing protein [Blastocatellia bacterium]
MKQLTLLFFLLLALALPALADSITLKFTGVSITNPSGQTATGGVMGADLVASSGPLMMKTTTSAITVNIGQNPFDAAWMFIAPNTPLASLDGYKVGFDVEVNGSAVGTVNTSLSVRPDGVVVATVLNPNLVFSALGKTLQLTFFITPNPTGVGPGNYDFQASLAEVPEPQTVLLLASGLVAGLFFLRSRKQLV